MRLYEEIFKSVDGVACARCILLPGGGGYLQGVKAVEDFSSEHIIVCFPKKRVVIEGEGLSIGKYCDGDLQIDGCIVRISVEKEGENLDGRA
jgi:hypothetical protein